MSKHQQNRTITNISCRGVRVLIAFVLGQAVQLIVHAVALNFNMWSSKQIPWCAAAGFIITVAVFAGIRIAVKEGKEEISRADDWRP